MIKRLLIKNFKSIEELDMELRPLTVVCGPNSVGKSSIGQALLLLKQSNEQYGSVSMLRPTGNLVDVGGYPDFIHKHEIDKKFSIMIGLDVGRLSVPPKRLFAESPPEVHKFFESLTKVKELNFNFSYGYDSQKEETTLRHFCIESPDGKFSIKSKTNTDNTYQFSYSLGEKGKRPYRINPRFQTPGLIFTHFLTSKTIKDRISGYMKERVSVLQFINYISIIPLNWELNNLNYLGPFREPPKRTYSTGGAKPEGIEARGQLTIDYLTYSSVVKEDGSLGFVKEWLNRFGYASDFSIEKIHGLIWKTNLKNKSTGIPSTLLDVGFGISQVLPVIVAIYLHKRGLHIFEQPEIHLHPASQADLADLFMETITEDKQYLVETHSEHFLNRIRRRIVEGKINPEKVIVYYIRYKGPKLEVDRIFVEENGSFKDIPNDFFGESLFETKAIMEARKQRKLL